MNEKINKIKIKIRRKEGCEDLPLPSYTSKGASGMDLYADVEEETLLKPGEIKLISTGIYLSIPSGYEAQIRPRSGLALKEGISVLNSPGTIDSDFRGLVGVILINLGKHPYRIKRKMRIAQMVIKRVTQAEWIEVGGLDRTPRNEGGFGHTGI